MIQNKAKIKGMGKHTKYLYKMTIQLKTLTKLTK